MATHKYENSDEQNPDDPKPLNFDEAETKGVSDRLDKPYVTPKEMRGDNQDDQDYELEEAISPEENKLRKEEEGEGEEEQE